MRPCSGSGILVPLFAIRPRTSSPPALFPMSSLVFPLTFLAGSFTTPPCAMSSPLRTSRLTSAASGGAEPGAGESKGGGFGGAEPGGAEPGGAEPAGVETGGAEPEGVEPGGAESEGAESGDAEPRGTASSGGPAGASL
ncbi:unnamed protein product [Closterium sp. NIES-54]